MHVTIEITGDKQLIAKMQRLSLNMYNHRTAMKNIGDQLKRYYGNEAFASEGGVFGAQWAPLSAATLRSRTRRSRGPLGAGVGANQPLVGTGKMRKSFYYNATKDSVTITNKASYFKYHQSELPRKRLPRRQMIGVNSQVRRIVQSEINDSVRRKLAGAGIEP